MKDRSIGGFIELEVYNGKGPYHTKALPLANGRSCLLMFLHTYKPRKVYLPYYTCNTLIDPLLVSKTPHEFYPVDENLEPEFSKKLGPGEYLLYINYMDVKNKTVQRLEKQYGSKLIIDNTQAFYHKEYRSGAVSFNSCRKFFGVADGGYLYMKKKGKSKLPENKNYIIDHLVSRMLGKTKVYYGQFVKNEAVQKSSISSMSALTESILEKADYTYCKEKRLENFNYLHTHLAKYNRFHIDMKSVGVPYAYPFLPPVFIKRENFYKEQLYISTLWQDVLDRKDRGFKTERYLSENLLPLPLDQRYGKSEMQVIVRHLKKTIQKP